jgi:serine/threonine protein kinase
VTKRIGSNGCTLWVAMHRILEKPAFLRRIPCHNCPPECIARFTNEIRLLGRINHPNIVSIHDCFQRDTDLFLVTQYVDAPTLSDFLRQGRKMNQLELIRMAEQCLDAFAYLHEMGCAYDAQEQNNSVYPSWGCH